VNVCQLDRASPVSMWHQIELALAADIKAGVLPPRTRLPNEETLAARLGVHRHTARRALATLPQKGHVRIRRGLGTFAEPQILTYPISQQTRFTATLESQNRSACHELLEAFEQAADPYVAGLLKIAPGPLLTALRTLGLADGVPVSVRVTYFPTARFSGLMDRYRVLRSSQQCWSDSVSSTTAGQRPASRQFYLLLKRRRSLDRRDESQSWPLRPLILI
jgi:GntR family phosphonate transport system transcriptional regulator